MSSERIREIFDSVEGDGNSALQIVRGTPARVPLDYRWFNSKMPLIVVPPDLTSAKEPVILPLMAKMPEFQGTMAPRTRWTISPNEITLEGDALPAILGLGAFLLIVFYATR